MNTLNKIAVLVMAGVLSIGSLAGTIPAFAVTAWSLGDVFTAMGGGSYNVYTNAGVFKEVISDGWGGSFTTGCAFNNTLSKLYTTNFSNTKVSVYNDAIAHTPVVTVNTGAENPGGHSESIVFAANGDYYVGHPDGDADIQRYNSADAYQQSYNVAVEARGSDWMDLAFDQKTMFYTSEGRLVKRYDVSGAGAQLADFADLTGVDPVGTLFALRLLPPGDGTGGLLVADNDDIKRLDGAGAVAQTYDAAGVNGWFSLNLDPNGTSFWAGDSGTNNFYRFDIATGALEIGPIVTGGSLFGLCLKGEPTAGAPSVEVEKNYRFTNVCFEKDNDGDGSFSEDPVDGVDNDQDGLVDEDPRDCPNGTNLGAPLPVDGSGNYVVQAVVKKNGTVSSYNPGQYYAVSTVKPVGNLADLWIHERYGECTDPAVGSPISALNPAIGGGGGNVVVVEVGLDGVAKQITDSNSPDVTITDEIGPNGIPDDAHAHLTNVVAGHTYLMYVKFSPGLKGLTWPGAPQVCENENEAQTELGDPGTGVVATADLTVVKK